MVYLDHAATTAPLPEVLTAMEQFNTQCYYNPSSLHAGGVAAEKAVSQARKIIAGVLHAEPEEIYFSAGGTLCNNTAVIGGALARKRQGNKIVISRIEHACVAESAKSLSELGFEVVRVEPTVEGFRAAIDEKTVLVSAMYVNNETGLILPVDQLKKIITEKKAPALFHIDAVQALGKVEVNVRKLGCDLLTVSAHKIHGPKGAAALFVKKGTRLLPIYHGGGQEKGLFSGTHNTPAIVGFGKAVELIDLPARRQQMTKLCDYFLSLAEKREYLSVNRDAGEFSPHIVNVSFLGYVGENVLHFLESKGVLVSVGAACSNNSGHGSILSELHADRKTVAGAIRVSFSHLTVREDIDAFFAASDAAAKELIKKYK